MNGDAKELVLFINNEGDLYRQQHLPILKNLMTKHAQGKYDRNLAVKLFMYLVDNGAKKAQHGTPGGRWNEMFPKKVREEAAAALRDEFEDEAQTGAYDEYIPKKYKGVSGKTMRLRPSRKTRRNGVIPLTREEAQEWLEAAGEYDELESYFKDNLEDA